jgi:hypothetical protein
MADTNGKTLAVLALLVSVIAVWIAWKEYQKKTEQRPTLDIISAVVTKRTKLADFKDGFEMDDVQLTIKNNGSVEATNIRTKTPLSDALEHSKEKTLQSLGRVESFIPDIPVGEFRTTAITEAGQKGDPVQRTKFTFRLHYEDRSTGKALDEDCCFYTNQFEATKDVPTDENQQPISLKSCGRTFR